MTATLRLLDDWQKTGDCEIVIAGRINELSFASGENGKVRVKIAATADGRRYGHGDFEAVTCGDATIAVNPQPKE